MVGIAFDVYHLRNRILGLVAERINDDAATHRTIGAGAAGFRGPRNFEALRLSVDRSQIKSQSGQAYSSSNCTFEESATGKLHLCDLRRNWQNLREQPTLKVCDLTV